MQKESNVGLQAFEKEKIQLVYQEKLTAAFVYNINDWETLRKRYKIVGETFGHAQFTLALPLRLNPEEVVFLVNNGIAKLVEYVKLNSSPTEQDIENVTNFQKNLFDEEKLIYANLRKEEIKSSLAKIIAGKRKHGDERSEETILQDELQKSSVITDNTMIWPITTEPIKGMKGDSTDLSLETVFKYTTKTKCLVYEDLWKRGFYITPGQKFGADFLVYLGDPILYHAVYIVRCVEDCDNLIHPSELVAFGRLGTSVKKKAVLASLNADCNVAYITLNWIVK